MTSLPVQLWLLADAENPGANEKHLYELLVIVDDPMNLQKPRNRHILCQYGIFMYLHVNMTFVVYYQ